MIDPRIFDLFRRFKRRWTRKQAGLTHAEVDEINAVLTAPETPASTVAAGVKDSGIMGKGGTLTAIVGAVAATSLLASIPKDEGSKLAAYRDIAGIVTICNGDTKNVRMGMVETPEGCQRRLEAQLVAHAKPVMECTGYLRRDGTDWQRAAAVSLAYNIGVRAYCKSSVDRLFDAGQPRAACDAFLNWSKARVGGQLRVVKGLLNRRQRERALCLKGLA